MTGGTIKNFLSHNDVGISTKFIVISAMYITANWKNAFDPSLTKIERFFCGQEQVVNMMCQNDVHHRYLVDENKSQWLEMEYENSQGLCMGFHLPEAKTPTIQPIPAPEKFKETEMDQVKIPKFNQWTKLDFGKSLKSSGLEPLFNYSNDPSTVHWKGLTDEDIKLDKLIQLCSIEVNERSTLVASSTSAILGSFGFDLKPKFVANRPFMYYIRNLNTGVVYVQGLFS
jgi:serine protease inhibitor